MMGKNKKPSECQITKNLRLYRCRVTRMRKAFLKTKYGNQIPGLGRRQNGIKTGRRYGAFWGYRDAFHAARPSAVWDTSEK